MGKKPFILMAIGVFLILGIFIAGDSEPRCGRGGTFGPGEVCVNEDTGDTIGYEEAKANENRAMRIAFPIIGTVLIASGAFIAVKRKRNPNWRAPAVPQPVVAAGPPVQQPPAGQHPQAAAPQQHYPAPPPQAHPGQQHPPTPPHPGDQTPPPPPAEPRV